MQRNHISAETRARALSETGDIFTPIREGAITWTGVKDKWTKLFGRMHVRHRKLAGPKHAITLFKSVGDSHEHSATAKRADKNLVG